MGGDPGLSASPGDLVFAPAVEVTVEAGLLICRGLGRPVAVTRGARGALTRHQVAVGLAQLLPEVVHDGDQVAAGHGAIRVYGVELLAPVYRAHGHPPGDVRDGAGLGPGSADGQGRGLAADVVITHGATLELRGPQQQLAARANQVILRRLQASAEVNEDKSVHRPLLFTDLE